MTWTGSAIFPLCLAIFHFVLHIFRKFRISAFCQYLHCWGFSQHKKSYGRLKFSRGHFTYLWTSISYIYIYQGISLVVPTLRIPPLQNKFLKIFVRIPPFKKCVWGKFLRIPPPKNNPLPLWQVFIWLFQNVKHFEWIVCKSQYNFNFS